METPPAPTAADVVKDLADLLRQQPPVAPPTDDVPAAPPAYTPDEERILTDYEKNWPDVAQAEQLKRRAEYSDLMKFVFSEVVNYVAPTVEQVRMLTNSAHLSELKDAVPDYDPALEANVSTWVDGQPAYLQSGMKQVMQSGTSEEVADLIGRYRAATGTVPAPAAPAAPAPSAPAKPAHTELSSAAKQAAESLAPVSSDRSQVPAGEDPGEYASAFARYAAESMQN